MVNATCEICEDVTDIKQGLDGTNYSSCDEEGDDIDLEFEDPNVDSECTMDYGDKHEHGPQKHPFGWYMDIQEEVTCM